jgi:hypothetical protein
MKISIDSVIDSAKFNLGLRDTTYADADLERLIDEGSRHMGKLSGFIISCETVEIDCAKAKLPDRCTEIICFSFPNQDGCSGCCNFSFDPATESNPWPPTTNCGCFQYYVRNRNVLTEFCNAGASACGWNQWTDLGFDTQNGYLVFPSTITATEVKVWFRGWNEDEDGIMVLDVMDERGLAAYASYKYASAGQNIKAYTPMQVKGWQQEWIAQKNMRIAQEFSQDAKAHSDIWGAICRGIILNPFNVLNQNL